MLKEEYETRLRSLEEELAALREENERINKECSALKEKGKHYI